MMQAASLLLLEYLIGGGVGGERNNSVSYFKCIFQLFLFVQAKPS